MSDRYRNFADLELNERAGVDYRVLVRRARPEFVVAAPHGGGIEPGTSELADAIASVDFSLYAFEGLKAAVNADLHITSTHFDEPICLVAVSRSDQVLTLHGEGSDGGEQPIFIGGLAFELRSRIGSALTQVGFDVRVPSSPDLEGLDPNNLCNRGRSRAGVQLELSRAVRRTLFESLGAAGSRRPTARFHVFTGAVRAALCSSPIRKELTHAGC